RQTATGTVMGTPAYMSPEQALGKKDVGPAADVYSLGAILFECLTGRPPVLGETTGEVLINVVQQAVPDVRSLAPQTPAELAAICAKCLSKKPAGRYADAVELAEALRRCLEV